MYGTIEFNIEIIPIRDFVFSMEKHVIILNCRICRWLPTI